MVYEMRSSREDSGSNVPAAFIQRRTAQAWDEHLFRGGSADLLPNFFQLTGSSPHRRGDPGGEFGFSYEKNFRRSEGAPPPPRECSTPASSTLPWTPWPHASRRAARANQPTEAD